MDFNTLYPSLVASYEAGNYVIPLIDEDFAADPTGDWVKYKGHWRHSISLKLTDSAITGALGVKTWHGHVTPSWVTEAQDNHSAFCREVDMLPRFSRVTTRDQRILRYAKQRAKELLNSHCRVEMLSHHNDLPKPAGTPGRNTDTGIDQERGEGTPVGDTQPPVENGDRVPRPRLTGVPEDLEKRATTEENTP